MERYYHTLGIIINSRYIKESDLLITLLTPNSGKITCLAKGAKNIRSSRLGNLQLGNVIKANLYKKGDYYWLSESTPISQFLQNHKSLTQINLLFYFLEILNYFVAENQQIEGIYQTSEKIISSITNNQLASFIKYEIQFINTLGFGFPKEIQLSFDNGNYIDAQKKIKIFLESIIEKPLQSNKLFK